MKNVVLIGDSIRMGYAPTVVSELAGAAEVWAPEVNGKWSGFVIENLDDWAVSRRPDAVHINCGLHDLARLPENNGNVRTPLDQYEANLTRIFETLTTRTNAAIIWATTTPTHEENHKRVKAFDRYERDVVAYNDASLRAAARFPQIRVNDLYGFVMGRGRDNMLGRDGVHYPPESSVLLGKAVAESIRAALNS